jgi:hypothetical protein
MRIAHRTGIGVTRLILLSTLSIHALEPVDGDFIPEARAVLDYFTSVYKQETITATNGHNNAAELAAHTIIAF